MPIFEYKCEECGSIFEMFLKNRDEEVRCLKCDSIKVKKLFSSFYSKLQTKKEENGCASCPVQGCPKKHNL